MARPLINEEKSTAITELAELCRFYGERFDLTQAAGGNVSIKIGNEMLIKASGVPLSCVTENDGWAEVNNKRLSEDVRNGKYEPITNYNTRSYLRGSMETYMHSLLYKYVVHLHPIQVNSILIREDAREICKRLLPKACFLGYAEPGVELSKELFKIWKGEKVILLANHGIIVTSDSLTDIYMLVSDLLKKCEKYQFIDFSHYKMVNHVSFIFNQVTGDRFVSYLCEDSGICSWLETVNHSLFPDKVIFCGAKFLICHKLTNQALRSFIAKEGYIPKIVQIEDKIYVASSSLNKCKDIESILKAHSLTIPYCKVNMNKLSETQEKSLINMEAEKYRIKCV